MTTTVTMLQLRKDAEAIMLRVSKGQRYLLTYRGRPVARLEPPASDSRPPDDDPFYRLGETATSKGKSLTNREIDRILYGA
jgi:prevent-host-death family protein